MQSIATNATDGKTLTLLGTLARRINDAHADFESAARSAVDLAIDCGNALIEAKAAVRHGDWLPWLASNCPTLPQRTAQAYMRLARGAPTLKSATVADLGVRQALKLLAEPKEEPEAVQPEPTDDPLDVALRDGEIALAAINDGEAGLDELKARLPHVGANGEPLKESVRECLRIQARGYELAGKVGVAYQDLGFAVDRILSCMIDREWVPAEAVRWSPKKRAAYFDALIAAAESRLAELKGGAA